MISSRWSATLEQPPTLFSMQRASNSRQQPVASNCLAQSAPFPGPLPEQKLTGSDDGIYAQLHKDYYSGVSFPTKLNPPISEQHSYPAFPSMDHNSESCQLHANNLSGLEQGNGLTQTLPGGRSIDGTLFSATSQYKEASAADSRYGGSSPRQLLEVRTQVGLPQNFLPRTRDPNTPFPNMHGNTGNMGRVLEACVGQT